MGSISGLISILLLADLCTCRISEQNQGFKVFILRDFWLLSILTASFYHTDCLGLINSPWVIVL